MAAIVVGWTGLTAQSCGGDGSGGITGVPAVHQCTITNTDPTFPAGGGVVLSKPASCPIQLLGGTQIPYAATATLPNGSVGYGIYEADFTPWRSGAPEGMATYAVWSQGNNGAYFVTITGDYTAASAGFDTNNRGYDDIRNGFFADGQWTYATARIDYIFGNPSNTLSAPADVEPYQTYPVSATTGDPMLVSPVTWSWYVDGALAGTTTDPQFSVTAGDPLAQQQIQVVVTDGNGRSVSGQTQVQVTAGCGTQFIC